MNDEYDEDAIWYSCRKSNVDTETFLLHQLGKFQYETHAFALMVPPYERCRTKAIYLYMDGIRIMAVRANYDAGELKYLTLQYRSTYWRDHFHDTMEIIPKGRRPSLQYHFHKYFAWYQSGDGNLYHEWPFTLYRSVKPLPKDERAAILQAYEISI